VQEWVKNGLVKEGEFGLGGRSRVGLGDWGSVELRAVEVGPSADEGEGRSMSYSDSSANAASIEASASEDPKLYSAYINSRCSTAYP
jgi:hypothetical protein